jgi:hypothetical protein
MKNIAKLSLVTAISLTSVTTSLSANETLADAFTNGKIKGEIKSVYSNSNFLGKSISDDIATLGGSLGYTTADFYGFSAGATFQASHVISEDNNNNVFASDLDASGAILSEAYLEYKLSNTTAKVGRQFIYTPLVSTAIDGKSSESLLKDSFEAYMLTNTDLPDTTVSLGYISKYLAKTDENGDVSKSNDYSSINTQNKKSIHDDAYTILLKNNSIENLTLQAQYLEINKQDNTSKDINITYLQADYALGNQTLSAQYIKSKNDNQPNGQEDGSAYGLKATGPLGISNLAYILAFNSNTEDGDVNIGMGAGANDLLFTSIPVNGGGVPARANADTLVGGIVVPILDVTTVAYLGNSWTNGGLGDVLATGAMAIYPINKNLLLKANYEHVELEHTIVGAGIVDGNTDVTRVYLSYKF